MKIIELLSWLAIPVSLICIVDDWVLRPRRQIAAAAHPARRPAADEGAVRRAADF